MKRVIIRIIFLEMHKISIILAIQSIFFYMNRSHFEDFHEGNLISVDFRLNPQAVRPNKANNCKEIVPKVIITAKIAHIECHFLNQSRNIVTHIKALMSIESVLCLEVRKHHIYLVPTLIIRETVANYKMDEDDIPI